MLKTIGCIVLVAAYALASHLALVLPNGKTIAAALATIVPLAVALWFLATQMINRFKFSATVAFITAFVALALPFSTVWPWVVNHADNLYFMQHFGANAALAWVFGRTLTDGQTPLVVTFARIVHGKLPPEIQAYAGRVTTAWMVFFLLNCAVSAVLFFAAPLSWWSTFAVLLSWPLVGVFFVLEYGYRRWRFRHFDHASMKAGFDAYRAHQQKK